MTLRPARAMRATLAAAALAVALPAGAQDATGLSDAEFGERVRAYLLENPEVLMEALGVLEEREAAAQAEADTALVEQNAEALFQDGYSWQGGNPDGDLTIVKFNDYRCGFCRRAYPVVNDLLDADGNIRFVVKEFPILGDQSVLSSRFAIAVRRLHGADAYAEAHDALMTFRGDVTMPALERIAGDLGLDAGPIVAEMNSDAVTEEIAEVRALAQRLQITGTPTFVVGDQMLRGFLPLEDMEAVVAEVRGG